MRPSLWDRVATLNNPGRLVARMVQKAQLDYLADAFGRATEVEAAGTGRRFTGWTPSSTGPNVVTNGSLSTLRARHRQLVRDNPWCARARQAIVSHSVGHGISIEIKGTDGVSAADLKTVNRLWSEWYDSPACDADGRFDGYGLQALKMGATVESGEVFLRARWRRPGDRLPVPLQLQVLEADYCDHTKTEELQNGRIVQGIEFDTIGRRTNYWMFREHPGDIAVSLRGSSAAPVPATDIAHIFRADRPGQVHGMPWGVPVMLRLKELDGYEDAYLFRQKLANCFVGAVHDLDAPALGAQGTAKSVLPDSMEPGAMLALPSGKKVTFNAPPSAGDYGPFTRDVLLAVAVGYGITFQMLTGDLTKVNFTSGRMGFIDAGKNIDCWRWHMLIPQGIERIVGWFLQAVELGHGIKTRGMYAECTPPRRELLDPPREVPAEIKAIRGGLWSLKESHRSRGVRSEQVLGEVAEVNQLIDQHKLVLDTDPRKVSQVGNATDSTKETPDEEETA